LIPDRLCNQLMQSAYAISLCNQLMQSILGHFDPFAQI
jgi:hypothetical protein